MRERIEAGFATWGHVVIRLRWPLLAVTLEHVIALGFAPVTVPVLQGFFLLRPPLRGPPTLS